MTRILRLLVLSGCVLATVLPKATAETAYTIELSIYRIADKPVDILDEAYVQRASFNPDIEKKLAQPIRWGMDDTHVQNVLDSLTSLHGFQFHVEPGLIAPPKSSEAIAREYLTSGMLPPLMVEQGSARSFLKMVLQQLSLDFTVESDHIRIDRAEKLRDEPGFRTYTPVPLLKLINDGAASIGENLVRLGVDESPLAQDLLTGPNVQCWGRPAITVLSNQEGIVSIDDQSNAEYLEAKPRSDNKEFVLRNDLENTGITTKVRVTEGPDGKVNLTFKLNAYYIEGREVLPGTTLHAGKPDYRRRNMTDEFSMDVNRRSLILARVTADSRDTIAIFARIQRIETADSPHVKAAALSEYELHTRIVQVRGEPDWQWWMRPYERSYRMYAGAGRILGPVLVPHLANAPKNFDWHRLGFTKVKLSSPPAEGALIMGAVVDPWPTLQPSKKSGVAFRADTSRPSRPLADPSHEIFGIYKTLAPELPPLTPERLQYKTVNLMMTSLVGPNGEVIPHHPMLAIGEATPLLSPGLFRVDQEILFDMPRIETKVPSIRRRLEFSAELTDKSMLAYLVPVADDEYLIVLTDFNLVEE